MASPSPSGAGRCASWARRRCSTCPWSATWPGPWAASASSGAPAPTSPCRRPLAALEAGEMVAIMPQGTIPRGQAFFDPELKGRWGAARLAAMSGAPVVPIGLWGTEKVWPRNAKLPNLWNITDPPTVPISVGEPVALGLDDPDADTETSWRPSSTCCPPRPGGASPPPRSWRPPAVQRRPRQGRRLPRSRPAVPARTGRATWPSTGRTSCPWRGATRPGPTACPGTWPRRPARPTARGRCRPLPDAMPMVAPMSTVMGSSSGASRSMTGTPASAAISGERIASGGREIGSLRDSMSRSAMVIASSGAWRWQQMMPNSSPPSRAVRSSGRRVCSMRWATEISTSSPARGRTGR